ALAAPGQKISLHLARVCEPSSMDEHSSQDAEAFERAEASLRSSVEQIRAGSLVPCISAHHLPVTWSVIRETDAARALVRLAEQEEETEGAGISGGCQLIAMSTHGRSGFQRWMPGSITERVLHAPRRPILIVRPPEQAKGQAPASGQVSYLDGSLVRS